MKLLIALLVTIGLVHADHWAVIVAGSSGYYNYRHQADALHAYHVMVKNGIPPKRIILMMYDDVAHSSMNPTPGVIINRPGGPNLYANVSIDYRRRAVTPKTFTNVLLGKKDALKGVGTGRVLESGPDDHVFINFVDHGAPGLVGFPTGLLTARSLNDTITKMFQRNMFKQMVLYVEACESGSMFDNILSDRINVFSTTAANGVESSYACYFSDKYNTYLGDVYSVKWMEDSDTEDLNKETLEQQFKIVRSETNTSHVMQFGDMDISRETLSNFQAEPANYVYKKATYEPISVSDAVKSEDVPMAILRHKLRASRSYDTSVKIIEEMASLFEQHENIRQISEKIVYKSVADTDVDVRPLLVKHVIPTDFDCYEEAMFLFNERCFNLNKYEYALRHLYKLVNLCENNVKIEAITSAIMETCAHIYKNYTSRLMRLY